MKYKFTFYKVPKNGSIGQKQTKHYYFIFSPYTYSHNSNSYAKCSIVILNIYLLHEEYAFQVEKCDYSISTKGTEMEHC